MILNLEKVSMFSMNESNYREFIDYVKEINFVFMKHKTNIQSGKNSFKEHIFKFKINNNNIENSNDFQDQYDQQR